MNFLQKTLKELGFSEVGRKCGKSRQAVSLWYIKGKLPDSEHYSSVLARSTDYASVIAKMAKCKRSDLL